MMIVDGLFDFEDRRYPAGSDCTVRLRVWQLAGGMNLVLASDVPANCGASVTNTTERWAAEACKEYSLDPAKTLFVEHYDRRSVERGMHSIIPDETFDFVSFEWSSDDVLPGLMYARGPKWRHGAKLEVEKLIGEKLP